VHRNTNAEKLPQYTTKTFSSLAGLMLACEGRLKKIKNHATQLLVPGKIIVKKSRLQKTQTAKEGTCQIFKSPNRYLSLYITNNSCFSSLGSATSYDLML
jgi:hypothetical protein